MAEHERALDFGAVAPDLLAVSFEDLDFVTVVFEVRRGRVPFVSEARHHAQRAAFAGAADQHRHATRARWNRAHLGIVELELLSRIANLVTRPEQFNDLDRLF